ncbi:hypothetical protein [Methylomonas rapida]|uniref:Uncharacterized protein n=1 Tax=Methylomonas rapida TaxID=2963939 RepID=A0ABY7GJK0_9GAMM|nr:hypothetical protein [Methylomonas rapida]WAR44573.1 hypothetical protein NM686_019840 [Methylomonas rapida]
MTASDFQELIGYLIVAFSTGFKAGYLLAAFKMAAKAIFPPR